MIVNYMDPTAVAIAVEEYREASALCREAEERNRVAADQYTEASDAWFAAQRARKVALAALAAAITGEESR